MTLLTALCNLHVPTLRDLQMQVLPEMQLPALQGLVRRRILVNFRVAPDVMERHLPSPFRPKLVDGWALAGICLIRLEQIRPRGFPSFSVIVAMSAKPWHGWNAFDSRFTTGTVANSAKRRMNSSRLSSA